MSANAIIKADGITVGYDLAKPVLQDFSFEINKGELVGIIGKNGAGKSTLLKALRGFLPLQQGASFIDGRNVSEYSERDIAAKIAYLQQTVELAFDYTARDIVTAGRYPYKKWWQQMDDRDYAIIDAAMAYTGVTELSEKPIRSMSGGQRQRVLLAKVLAQQTPILFLDEPSSGLDIYYQEEIFRFCQELCKRGKTVIMVVHELHLAARFCTRVLLVHHSRLLADGKPSEVFTDEKLSTAYDAAIKAVVNPVTDHTEVYTVQKLNDAHKRKLLNIILGESASENDISAQEANIKKASSDNSGSYNSREVAE